MIALLTLCNPLSAGEFAVLKNGFRIHADRHETAGSRMRLYEGTGVTELAVEEVDTFEAEETVAAAQPVVQAPAPTAAKVLEARDIFSAAAEKNGLPVALVRSVVKAESNFQPNAISPKGAIGLMQLMPGTARDLGVDPANPQQNVEGGTKYLRDLLVKYSGSEDQVAKAIAAYNAGPNAVDRYKGVPPYAETQTYVRRVLIEYLKIKDR